MALTTVDTNMITDGAVTQAKIADGNVTGVKVATGTLDDTHLSTASKTTLRTSGGLSGPFAHFQDQKTNGTEAGASTGGTSAARTLNATVVNTITGCSLGSNQVTLPAGTYHIIASAPNRGGNQHRVKIYNVTDAANALLGGNEYNINANSVGSRAMVHGRITIAAQKVFELRHYIATSQATNGLGVAASSGDTEVYAEIMIWQL